MLDFNQLSSNDERTQNRTQCIMQQIAREQVDLWNNSDLTSRDRQKLNQIEKTVVTSLASLGRGNTTILANLTNLIEKVKGWRVDALDGGQRLRDQVINVLWHTYTIVETNGRDDSYHEQYNLPQSRHDQLVSDSRGCKGWIFYNTKQKVKRLLPDSKLSASDQYLALEVSEKFEDIDRARVASLRHMYTRHTWEKIEYGVCTDCTPLSFKAPVLPCEPLKFTPEVCTGKIPEVAREPSCERSSMYI